MKLTFKFYRAVFSSLLLMGLLAACALPKIQLPSFGTAAAPTETAAATPEVQDVQADLDATATVPATETTAADSAPLSLRDNLSGLILFTSTTEDPINSTSGAVQERSLWALTPDGKRAEKISPDGYGSALVPVSKPGGKPLFMAYGLNLTSDAFIAAPPPDACLSEGGAPCSGFEFGLQGRTYAYFSGEASCGRTLTLVERAPNTTLNTWSHVAWFHFYADGSLILAIDNCAGKVNVYQYIPNTGVQSGISPDGLLAWDPTQKAALVQVKGASAIEARLWGFNLDESHIILWPENGSMQDTPVWLSDGHHFVYQHRTAGYDKDSGNAFLGGPRQIILMDAWTRSQKRLAFAPGYDFHLCASEGEPCEQPYGDWLKVTRTPFQPGGLILSSDKATAGRCALFGVDCMKPAEEFALNWKTGEMLPWAEASLPAPEAVPAFPPPDQTAAAIYTAEDSSFALYTSANGRALWSVPADGDPVMLVADGENFVYVP